MDIKVENKDIVLNDNGSPVMIEGIEQGVQQLKLACDVQKGTFVYDREMGLEVSDEIFENPNRNKTIEAMLNELLIDIPNITVSVQSLDYDSDIKKATVTVADGYNSVETEVILYENL